MPPRRGGALTQKAQQAIQVSGFEKENTTHNNGTYIQLVPQLQACTPVSCFRRLCSGSWSFGRFIFFESSEKRWFVQDVPWQSRQRYARSSVQGPDQQPDPLTVTWQTPGSSDDSWEDNPKIQLAGFPALQLSKKDKDLAQDAIREDRQYTPWRCTAENCPKACGNRKASDWGLKSERELAGHLSYYHRSQTQYYELSRKFWNQELAEHLDEQLESQEELLKRFQESLYQHEYELRTMTQTVAKHVNNLKRIADFLGQPLTRQLATDEEAHEKLVSWPDNISAKGHYTVSLGWLRKFREVDVLEKELPASSCPADEEELAPSATIIVPMAVDDPVEALATDSSLHAATTPQETAFETDDVAEKRTCRKYRAGNASSSSTTRIPDAPQVSDAQVSDAQETATERAPKRRRSSNQPTMVQSIAKAKDPIEAIIRLGSAAEHAPRENVRSEAQTARGSYRRPTPPGDLSELYARAATGNQADASAIAKEIECGICQEIFQALSWESKYEKAQYRTSAELEFTWLWTYCSASAARAILVSAVAAVSLHRALADNRQLVPKVFADVLLKVFAVVALSPFGRPSDAIGIMDMLFRGRPFEDSQLHLKFMGPLAGKAFRHDDPVRLIRDHRWPGVVKVAAFAILLAKRFHQVGIDPRQEVEEFESAFKETMQLFEGLYRTCFLMGLQWTLNPRQARESLIRPKLMGSLPDYLHQTYREIQDTAHKVAQSDAAKCGMPWNEPASAAVQQSPASNTAGPPPQEAVPGPAVAPMPGPAVAPMPRSAATPVPVIEVDSPVSAREAVASASVEAATVHSAPVKVQTPKPGDQPFIPAQPSAVTQTKPVQTGSVPAKTATSQGSTMSIQDLDAQKHAGTLVGRIAKRYMHRTGNSFHIRIRDATGEIDVKFWNEAAESYKDDPRLSEGHIISIRGFKFIEIKEKDKEYEFAPAGRKHSLHFNYTREVQLEASSSGALSVAQALELDKGCFDLQAWVVDAEENAQEVETVNGKMVRRFLYVADSLQEGLPRTKWTLWNELAKNCGRKLFQQKILARGVMLKVYREQKEFTGCRHGVQVISSSAAPRLIP